MRLSADFWLDEFIKTGTGLYNIPTQRQVRNLVYLTNATLQPLRNVVGVLNVSSGYRSRSVNSAVGGALYSQHMAGEAADVSSPYYTPAELIANIIALGLPFDQAIDERTTDATWLHISLTMATRKNRREVLTINT